MTLEAIVFRNSRDQDLVGVIHHARGGGSHPLLIVCHGFAGTKVGGSRRFVEFARYASEQGISVLRFDFAGSGDSDGDLTDLTLEGELDDLQAAINTVSQLQGVDPHRIGVLGHCMGAITALRGAAVDSRIFRTVAWAPFTDLDNTVAKMVGEDAFCLLQEGEDADFLYNEQLFRCGPALINRKEPFDLAKTMNQISGPTLVIHGSEDSLVPLSQISRVLNGITGFPSSTKQLLVLEGAHHSFPYHKDELFRYTLDWFKASLEELGHVDLGASVAVLHK